MKIAILGGTFNPPHKTHVEIARQALSQLDIDKLLVIPCGQPPHKFCSVDKQHRLNMAKLAFSGLNVEIDTYEVDRTELSYTLDTVRYVIEKYKSAEIYLLIGGDSMRDLCTWHEPKELSKLVTFVVAERGGVQLQQNIDNAVKLYNAKVITLDTDVTNYSSTEIRLKYQFNIDVDEVPESVNQYIKQNGLFQQYSDMTAKLRQYLLPQRFSHSFYVVKAGLELKSNCQEDDVFVACALHDCAKYITRDKYYKYGFENNDNLPEPVVHAFLGAKVAEIDFGIKDKTILDAIMYHTTARPNMTELDMVVYVADKIEQSRPYPTAHLIGANLTETFYRTLKEAYQVCVDRHRAVSPLTEQAINYYKKLLTKE